MEISFTEGQTFLGEAMPKVVIEDQTIRHIFTFAANSNLAPRVDMVNVFQKKLVGFLFGPVFQQ